MFKEFKEFIARGNVIDLAVGVIIGAAFGKVVSSLVGDLIMPPLGLILSEVNFSNLGIVLKQASGDAPAVIFAYGKFIQTVIDFLIIAIAIFLLVKLINNFRRQAAAEPAPPTKEEELLTEIRDLLKAKS